MSQTEQEIPVVTTDEQVASEFTSETSSIPTSTTTSTPTKSFFDSMIEKFSSTSVDPLAEYKLYFSLFVIFVIIVAFAYLYFFGKGELADDVRKTFGKVPPKDNLSTATISTPSVSKSI